MMCERAVRVASVVGAIVLLLGSTTGGAQTALPRVPLPNQRPLTTLQKLGALQVPWTVAINPSANYVAIGSCQAVYIDVKDEFGKEAPRKPNGMRVGMADFDWTATGPQSDAAIGVYSGASAWSVCACQAAVEGTTINVTATYPSRALPEAQRMAGLAFRSYIELPVAPKHGASNPPGCDVLTTTTVAISVPPSGSASGTSPGAAPPSTAPGASATATLSQSAPPAAGLAGTQSGASSTSLGGSAAPQQSTAATTPASTPPSQRIALGPPPVAPVAPPSGLSVTGTPSHAHLTWNMSLGATGYAVRRWHKQFPECCRNSTTGGRATAWDDSNFPQSGVYVYEVTVQFPDGQSRSSTVDFTRPEPVNPASFIAKQTGEGAVTLSWQAVPGVEFYQLWGPGLPNTGVSVTGTSQQVTGVNAGAQEWMVGSFYKPGPVSTSISAFPKTSLNVTSTVAATSASALSTAGSPSSTTPTTTPGATSGHYRVIANGFHVLHETKDDWLSRDGKGDEVYGAFTMLHYDRRTDILLDHDLGRTKVIGDVNNLPGRIQGGRSSAAGGFQAGDIFPNVVDPSKRYTAPTGQSFPYLIWDGTLTDGVDAVILLPTLWEYDGHADGYDKWFQNELAEAPRIYSDPVVHAAMASTELALISPPGTLITSYGPAFNGSMVFEALLGGGTVVGWLTTGSYDRPIGANAQFEYVPILPRRAVVITREIIETALKRKAGGAPPAVTPSAMLAALGFVNNAGNGGLPYGTLAVPLFDGPGDDLQGQYVLYIQVERIP